MYVRSVEVLSALTSFSYLVVGSSVKAGINKPLFLGNLTVIAKKGVECGGGGGGGLVEC